MFFLHDRMYHVWPTWISNYFHFVQITSTSTKKYIFLWDSQFLFFYKLRSNYYNCFVQDKCMVGKSACWSKTVSHLSMWFSAVFCFFSSIFSKNQRTNVSLKKSLKALPILILLTHTWGANHQKKLLICSTSLKVWLHFLLPKSCSFVSSV